MQQRIRLRALRSRIQPEKCNLMHQGELVRALPACVCPADAVSLGAGDNNKKMTATRQRQRKESQHQLYLLSRREIETRPKRRCIKIEAGGEIDQQSGSNICLSARAFISLHNARLIVQVNN